MRVRLPLQRQNATPAGTPSSAPHTTPHAPVPGQHTAYPPHTTNARQQPNTHAASPTMRRTPARCAAMPCARGRINLHARRAHTRSTAPHACTFTRGARPHLLAATSTPHIDINTAPTHRMDELAGEGWGGGLHVGGDHPHHPAAKLVAAHDSCAYLVYPCGWPAATSSGSRRTASTRTQRSTDLPSFFFLFGVRAHTVTMMPGTTPTPVQRPRPRP